MPASPPALETRALTKRYDDGTLALEGFDLVVPDGAFFGLLGPNGAGKTTLISAVCNLIRVSSGDVLVFGEPADTLEARSYVGLAEQDINLDRFLTVRETLVYHGGYFGMPRDEAGVRAGGAGGGGGGDDWGLGAAGGAWCAPPPPVGRPAPPAPARSRAHAPP